MLYSKDDVKKSNALAITLICLFLTNYFNILSLYYSINYEVLANAFKILPIIAIIYTLPSLVRSKYSVTFLALIVGLLITFLISYGITDSKYYIEYIEYFGLVCLPCMIVVHTIKDYRYLFTILNYSSIIIAFFSLLPLFKYIQSYVDYPEYFMGYSNISAFFALVLFVGGKSKWRFFVLPAKIILISSVILIGSRGGLLIIALFVFFATLTSNGIPVSKKVLFILAIILFLFTYQYIFSFIYNLLSSKGIESRTLKLLSDDIGHLSGRDAIFSEYLNEIYENPFKFRGISYGMAEFKTYPHQIFIELIYQLGFIGILASIVIIFTILKSLFIKKHITLFDQKVELLFICTGVFSLLVSNTLWKSITFWLWIGYEFNTQKVINGEKNENS